MSARTISGRYEVIGLLGAGGIGQVFAARDLQLGRMVAIKALRSEYSNDQGFLDRFRAEASSLAGLVHPNIATLYDLVSDDQQLYMIMELVRGHTLEAVLTRCKRLGLREALAVIAQAAAGLSYVHRTGVIHRDIKPANLMLTENGPLKIMDFGIARVRGSQRLTRAGSIVGTLAYLAPEQIKGEEGDERSDLYSLACVTYEMLSGDPPFQADSEYDLIRAHVEARPQPLTDRLPGMPAPVEQALSRALAKNPADRFPSVDEFSQALGVEAIQGQAVEIVRTGVLSLAGPVAAQPTRILGQRPKPAAGDAGGAPAARPASGSPSGSRSKPATAPKSQDLPSGRASRMPLIVLGSVATVLVLGVGFVFSGLDTGSISTSPGSSTTTVAAVQPQPAPTPTPPPAPQRASDNVPNSDLMINPRTNQHPQQEQTALATPQVRTNAAPSQQASAPVSPGEPAYQGNVKDWMAADLLWVQGNGRPLALHLFGVIDASDSQADAERRSQRLNAFIASVGKSVTCYAKADKEFQCFAGTQDIALWAVTHGLARAAADAPVAYRDAVR